MSETQQIEQNGAARLEGPSTLNRLMYVEQLGEEGLRVMPEVHGRLQADPPARVADFGCGAGSSCIELARTYPNIRVDGFDADAAVVELARANVREAGLQHRVRIDVGHADDYTLAGGYDLVLASDCLYAAYDPVEALYTLCGLLKRGGTVLVVDGRVSESLAALQA